MFSFVAVVVTTKFRSSSEPMASFLSISIPMTTSLMGQWILASPGPHESWNFERSTENSFHWPGALNGGMRRMCCRPLLSMLRTNSRVFETEGRAMKENVVVPSVR